MTRNLDLALLRAFVTVAQRGSMTRAAGVLNLTQGAVSQQVKRLEEQLGLALFERDRAGLRLTSAGERLMPRAGRLLDLNDEAWAAMTAPEVEGMVTVGVPHDIVAAYIPPILKAFDRDCPRVQVTVVADTSPRLRAQLAEGRIDLTLTTEAAPGDGGEVLVREPLVWAGAPGGTAYARRPLPLALGDDTCAFRSHILESLARSEMDWRGVCAVSAMESLFAMTAADLGVVALLGSCVPVGLVILDNAVTGLPDLPAMGIVLYPPLTRATPALMLADHIRHGFRARAMA